MLTSLTYMSRPSSTLDEAALQALLAWVRQRNHETGVTGALLFTGHSFLQTIEGPSEVIEETFARVAKDPRHYEVTELWREEIDQRLFGEWTMAFRSARDEEVEGFRSLADHAETTRGASGPGTRCLAFHRAFQGTSG